MQRHLDTSIVTVARFLEMADPAMNDLPLETPSVDDLGQGDLSTPFHPPLSLEEDDDHLPNDVQTLKLLVIDLQRRLQNSQQLLQAQKTIAITALRDNDRTRLRLHQCQMELSMEQNKFQQLKQKQNKDLEIKKYENNKKKYEIMHQDLRLAMIDHKISNTKKEPNKLIKLRNNLEELNLYQESQKQLLIHLSLQEKLIEDLSSASQQNNLHECCHIIRQGVNVNEIDSAGFLPLHYACSAGSIEVVQLLLEFGSDYSSYLTGLCPVVLAADGGHGNVIQLLSSFGANINETGVAGTPAIVAAAGKGHLQAVETLLSLGATADAQDIEGNTALHFAAKLEKPIPILRTLLLHGANPKLMNGLGHTPLQVGSCSNLSVSLIRSLDRWR
jgi:ankyrin repeat protein